MILDNAVTQLQPSSLACENTSSGHSLPSEPYDKVCAVSAGALTLLAIWAAYTQRFGDRPNGTACRMPQRRPARQHVMSGDRKKCFLPAKKDEEASRWLGHHASVSGYSIRA